MNDELTMHIREVADGGWAYNYGESAGRLVDWAKAIGDAAMRRGPATGYTVQLQTFKEMWRCEVRGLKPKLEGGK